MKITGGGETRGVRPNGSAKSRGRANSAGFANHLDGPSGAGQTDAASGPGSVAALLAVQAAGDALEGRRQAYDRGEAILKRLDALRVALLEGRVDDAALRRLAQDIENSQGHTDDPALLELLAQIELRAAVELAKRGLV